MGLSDSAKIDSARRAYALDSMKRDFEWQMLLEREKMYKKSRMHYEKGCDDIRLHNYKAAQDEFDKSIIHW